MTSIEEVLKTRIDADYGLVASPALTVVIKSKDKSPGIPVDVTADAVKATIYDAVESPTINITRSRYIQEYQGYIELWGAVFADLDKVMTELKRIGNAYTITGSTGTVNLEFLKGAIYDTVGDRFVGNMKYTWIYKQATRNV